MLTLPMFHQVLIVIAPVTLPVLSNTAVSCANGKLLMSGVPPDELAHPVADQFWAAARFQYTVFAPGKVMPELPPQFPARVGDELAAAPAIAISLKSQSWADRVPTVRVRCVPRVSDRRKIRRTEAEPAHVSVPVMVWLAAKKAKDKPALAERAVNVKLLNVFMPLMVYPVEVVKLALVYDTL